MNLEEIRSICLSQPAATEQIQWDDDLVFKVAGKMFLVTGLEPGSAFSCKCDEETFAELTELEGIRPAPYLARAHWVHVDPARCPLDAEQMSELILNSYRLVVSRLPKKVQRELQA